MMTYKKFFESTGLPTKTFEEINTMLKTAVGNSKKKKYHGPIEHMFELPSEDIQIKEFFKN